MKVGIMSMQRIKNYGSFLQAYGLKQVIEGLGHEVIFVDYKVGESVVVPKQPNIAYRALRKIYRTIKGLVKKEEPVMVLPTKDIAGLSDIYNDSLYELGITEERNENEKVDVLVIGSDEVFNCLQSNPDVGYSTQLFGEKVNANKVISYAACCGFTTIERLSEYKKLNEVKKMLNKNFAAISVRDKNSFKLVETLTGKKPSLNLDPALITDFSERVIEKKDLTDYIIVYSYKNRIKDENEIDAIKQFAKEKGLKTVSIGNYQNWTDIKVNANSFELLGYFKNADYIITDTFHGTIFSVLFEKKFATLCRQAVEKGKYSNIEKLADLLERLTLTGRRIDSFNDLGNMMDNSIDYDKVKEIIKKERNNSINYLRENIK